MQIYAHRTELFDREAVSTEALAYQCLTRRPILTDVNYVASPWSVMINDGDMESPDLQLRGGFTICQHIWYHKIIPACISMGIDTLFTPHAERPEFGVWEQLKSGLGIAGFKRHMRTRRHVNHGFRILPFPHVAVNGIEPDEKEYWYSFIGFDTHWVRRRIFKAARRPDTVIKQRLKWHFEVSTDQRLQDKLEYQRVLAKTRYSLCPRGTGPSTIRFWESLQAGAIPVLISDATALPEGFDWSQCTVRIAERDVEQFESILARIDSTREALLRSKCREAYDAFSNANLVSAIRSHYDPQSAAA